MNQLRNNAIPDADEPQIVRLTSRQLAAAGALASDAFKPDRLLIEIDGYFHSLPEAVEKDAARTAWLISEGYRVIRFNEREVRENLLSVVDRIVAETVSPPSPALPPSRGKGEGYDA